MCLRSQQKLSILNINRPCFGSTFFKSKLLVIGLRKINIWFYISFYLYITWLTSHDRSVTWLNECSICFQNLSFCYHDYSVDNHSSFCVTCNIISVVVHALGDKQKTPLYSYECCLWLQHFILWKLDYTYIYICVYIYVYICMHLCLFNISQNSAYNLYRNYYIKKTWMHLHLIVYMYSWCWMCSFQLYRLIDIEHCFCVLRVPTVYCEGFLWHTFCWLCDCSMTLQCSIRPCQNDEGSVTV